MAMTQEITTKSSILDTWRTSYLRKRDAMKQMLARRRLYLDTYAELAAMSDRDLADLGFSRSEIGRIAKEAAHGH